jgi:hypothetical protein
MSARVPHPGAPFALGWDSTKVGTWDSIRPPFGAVEQFLIRREGERL